MVKIINKIMTSQTTMGIKIIMQNSIIKNQHTKMSRLIIIMQMAIITTIITMATMMIRVLEKTITKITTIRIINIENEFSLK